MFELIKSLFNLKKTVAEKQQQLEELEKTVSSKQELYEKIKNEALADAKQEAENILSNGKEESQKIISDANNKAKEIDNEISKKSEYIEEVEQIKKILVKTTKKVSKEENRFRQLGFINNKLQPYIDNFKLPDQLINEGEIIGLTEEDKKIYEELLPTVTLKLHSMDYKELRKKFRENDKLISEVLEKYKSRYTTKANIAIYKLMVIALKAELQNVLYNLKFNKLEKSIEDIKDITKKYLTIAGEGNQSIYNTAVKFIGEIECLFISAIEIEYEYYIKKEQEKEEQARLREQMRQEAEERKILEQQQKQMEKEEEKYANEIEKTKEQLANTEDSEKMLQLQEQIKKLQEQLSSIHEKKEEITRLQNGRAGYVYIISNIGSFGDNVFKIGMTRRLNPQDRVDELGDASVPFKFDVHSFIFSDSAVELEQKLHTILEKNRVNKINLRKEFFNVSLDNLENLVQELYPAAEFNRTMLAEEYRQSLSMSEYNDDEDLDEDAIV